MSARTSAWLAWSVCALSLVLTGLGLLLLALNLSGWILHLILDKKVSPRSTLSWPRAATTKLSPGTLLHSARSGLKRCATLRASSEGSRPARSLTRPRTRPPGEVWGQRSETPR